MTRVKQCQLDNGTKIYQPEIVACNTQQCERGKLIRHLHKTSCILLLYMNCVTNNIVASPCVSCDCLSVSTEAGISHKDRSSFVELTEVLVHIDH